MTFHVFNFPYPCDEANLKFMNISWEYQKPKMIKSDTTHNNKSIPTLKHPSWDGKLSNISFMLMTILDEKSNFNIFK